MLVLIFLAALEIKIQAPGFLRAAVVTERFAHKVLRGLGRVSDR